MLRSRCGKVCSPHPPRLALRRVGPCRGGTGPGPIRKMDEPHDSPPRLLGIKTGRGTPEAPNPRARGWPFGMFHVEHSW